MKKYLSIGWFVTLLVTGVLVFNNSGLGNYMAYVLYGIIGVTIINIAKPNVVISNKVDGIFWSKVMWNGGAQLILVFVLLSNFVEMKDTGNLRDNYKTACSSEQIAKTGKTGCETAKKEFLTHLNSELSIAKNSYKTAQNNVKQFASDKETKCSETGLENYGSEGCRLATEGFDTNTKLVEELNNQIETYQKELENLKK